MRTLIAFVALLCGGCTSYVVPDGPAPLQTLVQGNERLSVVPTPRVPARLAVVRIQAPEYRSLTAEGPDEGRYSVLSPQEWPDEEQLAALGEWPSVGSVSTLGRALLPERLESLDALRLAAAKRQADVLLIFTLETSFQLAGHRYAAAQKVPLGEQPDAGDGVKTQGAAVLMEVRTGYSYGAVTADAGVEVADWKSPKSLDRRRLDAERQAFEALMAQADVLWRRVAENPR